MQKVDPSKKIKDVSELHPVVAKIATELQNNLSKKGYDVRVIETYRPQERQDFLYSQGRKTKGQIVTKVKKSIHTDRKAFDLGVFEDGKYVGDAKKYQIVKDALKEIGAYPKVKWGGDWGWDSGHIEYAEPIASKETKVVSKPVELNNAPQYGDDVRSLANMIYGEGASTDYDTMLMIGSTALNRVRANKPKEFGTNIREVLANKNSYAAVRDRSDMYRQAESQRFPDKNSELKYKQAVAIASGLVKGTIEPKEGQFYFKENEIKRLRNNPKIFNFNAVKEVGNVGQYRVFSY